MTSRRWQVAILDMRNQDVIARLKALAELKYLFLFGKPKGLDRDYLAVFDTPRAPFEYELKTKGDDVYPATLNEFKQGLLLFDPVFTEPVLTGHVIVGSDKEYYRLKNAFLVLKSSPETVTYLRNKSKDCLTAAAYFMKLAQDNYSAHDLLCSLLDLTYAASYLLFARHYSDPSTPLTFASLQRNSSDITIKQLFDQYQQAKRGKLLAVQEATNYYQYLHRELVGCT